VRHDALVPHPLVPAGLPGGRLVAVLGAVAVLAWIAAVVVLLRGRKRREAAWAGSLLGLAAVAGLLGAREPGWHVVLIGTTAGIALRNVTLCDGAARWMTAVGLLAWCGAIVKARLLFG
jgi:uncharacterized membrane protein HdeD (DUF308 family)